ncbi:MAG: ribosome recycling factor [Alphaproteobacteria bacterium]
MTADLSQRMQGALNSLTQEFNGLRTGRASPDLLNPVKVEAYGQSMPISQVASVSVPETRTISVQVWDKGMVAAVEKAIKDSGLGLNPNVAGQTIRLNLPELNEQRRLELIKVAKKYAEDTRVAIRNVRRDGMDALKKQEKAGELSEDELKREETKVQKLTDEFIAKVEDMLAKKEKDITTV